jgi:photosystem II stability/assembly factor-like uncharacterized protein
MTDDFDPLKDALRDSLHRHAAEAPRGDLLAERIIHAAEQGPQTDRQRHRRSWRTWGLPLVAAGAVGAVVAAVVGVQSLDTTASKQQPGGSNPPSIVQTPPPTQLTSPPSPTDVPTTSSSPASTGLADVKIADLTFVGDNDGWALGSADCLSGPGRCTALWRTTDGRHWSSMPGAAFNVPGVQAGCAAKCVHSIRFANDQVGYAFGPSAFFMTTDGGATWAQQRGGALQLETLDDNVIRVTGTDSGCPGPCVRGIETSAVGSTDWTPATFSADSASVNAVLLARGNGGYAYLLVTRNPAGGSSDATSTLYRSTDLGASWHAAGEPCPRAGQEIDSTAVAGGADGRVAVLCVKRQAPSRFSVATSTDGGAHFAEQSGEIRIAATLLTGDPETVLVAAGDGMARSTDGGATWQRVQDVSGPIGWVGFESQQVGRAVSADGTTIWTTRDGGATWHSASIG